MVIKLISFIIVIVNCLLGLIIENILFLKMNYELKLVDIRGYEATMLKKSMFDYYSKNFKEQQKIYQELSKKYKELSLMYSDLEKNNISLKAINNSMINRNIKRKELLEGFKKDAMSLREDMRNIFCPELRKEFDKLFADLYRRLK